MSPDKRHSTPGGLNMGFPIRICYEFDFTVNVNTAQTPCLGSFADKPTTITFLLCRVEDVPMPM